MFYMIMINIFMILNDYVCYLILMYNEESLIDVLIDLSDSKLWTSYY